VALQELTQMSALAQHLLSATPVQMLILDRDLIIRWANETFLRARKARHEQVIGAHARNFFGDPAAHAAHFDSAWSGRPVNFLMSLPLADGDAADAVHDVNVFLRPVRDAGGAVAALGLFVGQPGLYADENVPVNARGMRQMIGSLPDYVLVLDRDLHVLFANRGVAAHTAEQLEGLHFTEFFPQQVHAPALAAMQRVLAKGELDSYAAEIDSADGQVRHYDVRVSPVRRGARIVGVTLNATDTTEQIRAQRAIATQARMIESMLEGVAVVNETGVIEITNPAFDTLFGYRRGELIGREMSVLAGWPSEQGDPWRPQRAAAHAAASIALEFDGRRRDGSHFSAAGVLSRFEVAGSNHSLVVLQDVSERKQLERAILQAVNREQYRIGNDLHDGLGQELTGIALMLRGLAGRLMSEHPPILPEIEDITRLVSNAIESTRALARGLSPVNLERGGLQDALEGLAMHASELYGVPILFTHRMQPARTLNPELANHLYRIAQEAVRNAVRHGKARSIRLHLHAARANVRLTITDDGVGLPADAVDAPGMGLKIMRYRARILGGEVSFEAAEPQGTRVTCQCPIEAPGSAVHAPRKPRRRAAAAAPGPG
jgi:PAS domain S-box-containing protein